MVIQRTLGYLGPEGTFTQEAALQFSEAAGGLQLVACRDIPQILTQVDGGVLDLGIVPGENAIEGSVAVTLDMLVHEVDLQIQGEIVISIRHNLLVPPGTDLGAVTRVVSHPQALAQCRHWLQEHLPDAEPQPAASTAEAARIVAVQGRGAAAIGTRLAASLYQLEIAAANLQASIENATRFFVVGHEEAPRTGHDKTSLVFAFSADRPGNLYKALGEFAGRNINLTKLESRPTKQALGRYRFFADLDGHRSDPAVAEAIAVLREDCTFFKILGSYPRTDYAGLGSPDTEGCK